MPTLHSHTTKTTGKQADEEEHRTDNRRLAQWRVTCFYESLVQGSSLVLLMNICTKNPPLRQAPNRCVPFAKTKSEWKSE